MNLDGADREELGAMYLHVKDAKSALARAQANTEKTMCATLDSPLTLADGSVAKIDRKQKLKGFDKDGLWDEVDRLHGRIVVDPETGENVRMIASKARDLLDVATGRSRAWSNAGVKLEKFASEDSEGWVDYVQVVK